jgi:hypothetical protein
MTQAININSYRKTTTIKNNLAAMKSLMTAALEGLHEHR